MDEPTTWSSETAGMKGRATGWRAVRRDWACFVERRGESGLWAYLVVPFENPSLVALWTYRYGYWAYNLCSRAWSAPHKLLYKIIFYFVQGMNHVVLDASAEVGDDVWLGPSGNIIVADTSRLGSGSALHGANTLGKVEGDPRFPALGRNVQVGPGTHILGPVMVPDDSVIGPNSVVVRSLPAGGGTWTGTPARPFHGPAGRLLPSTRTARAARQRRMGAAR